MTELELKQGQELVEIIKTTKEGLNNLLELAETIRKEKEKRNYDDGLYSLYIGMNRDNSGISADLCRYLGNAELLEAIIQTLEKQLDDYEAELEAL